MKPQPKQKLEQLVEDQEIVADQEALAEVEESQLKVSPYRTDEDLSYRLDIPRDVAGLVGLLEEKERLQNIDEPGFVVTPAAGRAALLGGLGSIIAAFGLAYYNIPETLGSFLLFIAPSIIGIAAAYGLAEKNFYKRKKEFQQQKAENVPLIEAIGQKLSHYEKIHRLSDITLVDDPELGYSLGRVIKNSKGELVLHTTYHKLQRSHAPEIDNRYWIRTSEEKPLAQANIISILKPSVQLSGDDLRSLEEGTPVLCLSTELLTSKPADHFSEHGFIDNKNTDDIFKIRTLRTFQGPGEHWYKFNQVQEGKINAYLLVPEIK